MAMDMDKIEEGVKLILEGIGEDPQREGLQKTPERVARMYAECFAGLEEDPAVHFETTFDEHSQELILLRDIPFFSMCEHHLAPFYGTANIAYIPAADGRICGLSKLARLVEVFARRPQVQERLTSQIADTLMARTRAARSRGRHQGRAYVHEHAWREEARFENGHACGSRALRAGCNGACRCACAHGRVGVRNFCE